MESPSIVYKRIIERPFKQYTRLFTPLLGAILFFSTVTLIVSSTLIQTTILSIIFLLSLFITINYYRFKGKSILIQASDLPLVEDRNSLIFLNSVGIEKNLKNAFLLSIKKYKVTLIILHSTIVGLTLLVLSNLIEMQSNDFVILSVLIFNFLHAVLLLIRLEPDISIDQ
ncbi:MAG: hypothetical protein ACXAD7_21960, partial [Candidatus Kariarchaeaceae archaeon]